MFHAIGIGKASSPRTKQGTARAVSAGAVWASSAALRPAVTPPGAERPELQPPAASLTRSPPPHLSRWGREMAQEQYHFCLPRIDLLKTF